MSAVTMGHGVTHGPGPSALDIPLSLTFFRDHAAQSKQEAETTLRALVPRLRDTSAKAKASLPWLKLATFGNARTPKGSLRHDGNMIAVHGVEADYDQESITVDRARQIIAGAGLAAIIYTSPSHTDAAPRWRVLCPLASPVAPSERARMLARLNGLFVGALAGESFTASQAYYYGFVTGNAAHQVVAIDGRALDEADELDAHAVGRPERPKGPPAAAGPAPRPVSLSDRDGTPYGLAGLARECQAIRTAGKGHKWETINRAAYSIGGLVGAGQILEGPAQAALRDAVYSLRGECDDFDHALNTLKVGFEDGMAAPRQAPPPRIVRRVTEEFAPPEPPPRDSAPDHWQAEPDLQPQPETHQKPDEPRAPAIWLDDEEWDEEGIQQRPWIARGYMLRGAVTVVSGPGGGGKSNLSVAWSTALATGRTVGRFAGVDAEHGAVYRQLVYNVEDDRDEQRRRYSAALRVHGLSPAAIRGHVARCGPTDVGTLIEHDPQTGRFMLTDAWTALDDLASALKPDVVWFDPLVELHTAEENDNTALRHVIARLRAFAKRHNCAVVLVHHARKGATAGDADGIRGAGSITGAARIALTVIPMTSDEADELQIPPDQRDLFFRVDGAKANYARRGLANWHTLAEHELKNGDTVAAVIAWQPGERGSAAAVDEERFALIEAAVRRGTPDGPYSVRLSMSEPRSILPLFLKHGIEARGLQDAFLKALSRAGYAVADFRRPQNKAVKQGLRSPDGMPAADWTRDIPRNETP